MNNKNIMVWILVIMIIPSAFAWTKPFAPSIDTSQYDECLLYYSETDCKTEFCNGNGKGDTIHCNYDNDVNRLFEAEMYPMTCDELNKWNSTEEIRFAFGVNVDSQDHNLNSRICQGEDNFDQFYKRDSYKVPYSVLNSVQSYETLWVDLFGAIYLERPTKSELETIYGNVLPDYEGIANIGKTDVSYLYDTMEEIPINDQIFSILSCNVDCDYQGVSDNDLNLPISTNGKKGGVAFDYTKKTVFLDELESERWADKQDLTIAESCSFWDNLLTNWECTNNFLDNVNLQNYYKVIDRLDSDIDYSYWYSNTNNVLNSFTCNYPKDVYTDSNITSRVSCQIGKTWEGVLFSPDIVSIKFDTIGISNTNNYGTARLNMDINFYLNGTTGTIINTGSSYSETEQDLDDFVDEQGDKISGVLDYLIKYDPEIKKFTEETIDNRVVFQEEVKSVLDSTLELNTYIFSFILLIAYFIEIFIFIGLFKLIVSSFNAMRKGFKDLFGIKGGKQ